MNPQTEPPPLRAALWYALLLLIAAGLQSTVAARISLFGGEPDFPLTLAEVAALLSNASVGAVAGFGTGLVTASLVGQTVGTYFVSRTISCWIAGWTTTHLYRGNALVVILGVLVASVLSEIIYLLAAPHLSLGHGLRASLIGSVWNAALAYPTLLLLRKCGWGRRL
jgi:rod shape-determining protein MreD